MAQVEALVFGGLPEQTALSAPIGVVAEHEMYGQRVTLHQLQVCRTVTDQHLAVVQECFPDGEHHRLGWSFDGPRCQDAVRDEAGLGESTQQLVQLLGGHARIRDHLDPFALLEKTLHPSAQQDALGIARSFQKIDRTLGHIAVPLLVHYAMAKHRPRPLRKLYRKLPALTARLTAEYHKHNR